MTTIGQIELRKYLLGLLNSEAEREAIELQLLEESSLLEELEAAEDDLIEDYLDGGLSPGESEAFEDNFILTKERRAKIRFTRIAERQFHNIRSTDTNPIEPLRGLLEPLFAWFQANRIRPLAAAGFLIVVTLGVVYFAFRFDDSETALAALNRAFEKERPLDARISGFEYAPKTVQRGAATPNVDVTARNLAERIILDDAARSETARNLHTLGRLYLAKKDFAEAEKALKRAAASLPDDPEIINDLGVALLESAKLLGEADGGRKLELYAQAIDEFSRAVDLKNDFTPALFNKAVTLGEMNLPGREAEAWRDYLKIDDKSPWAAEARRRLEAVESALPRAMTADDLTREFLDAYRARNEDKAFELISGNREMITGRLIQQRLAFLFVDSETGATEAADYISAMKFVGELEQKKTGDASWAKMAEYYAVYGGTKKVQLKEAQDKIRGGYELCLLNRYSDANPLFADAAQIFGEIDNDFEAGIANYWIGYTLDRMGKYQESRAILQKLAEESRSKAYGWLESQAINWLAMIQYSTATDISDSSIANEGYRLAAVNRDVYGLQKSSELISAIHRRIGKYSAALDFGSRGVNASAFSGGSLRQRWRGLSNLAELFFFLGYYIAAEEIMKEAFDLTQSGLNEKTFEYMALLRLGQIAARRQEEPSARDYFLQSRSVASQFEVSEREKLTAYLDLSAGNAYREMGDCGKAAEFYQAASLYYSSKGDPVEQYDVQKGFLICGLAAKDQIRIDEFTPKVLEMLDRYRAEITDETGRNGFFGGEQEVYDALIEYQAGRKDYAKAFEYSEISRSRSLLAMMSTSDIKRDGLNVASVRQAASPVSVESLQRSLPENVQILQYAVLRNAVYCWIITRNTTKAIEMPVQNSVLMEKVGSYISALSQPAGSRIDEGRREAAELASLIFEPVRPYLDPKFPVVIIPDKVLSGLPFAALRSPQTGKYLIEDFELQYSSSAATFLLATAGASRLPRHDGGENLLAVGNPAFDTNAFPNLESLGSAKREVNSISGDYSLPNVLTGAEATKQRLIQAVRLADVFHFAGHYVYDDRTPNLSGFVLADDDKSASRGTILRNSEILRMEFPRTKLVVLSACRTGGEKIIDGEGMLGAARTFLAKGIPLVIASHWEVDSAATANLMTRFHWFRTSGGLSSASALRKAQLEFLSGDDQQSRDPYYWAAFVAFGGQTAF